MTNFHAIIAHFPVALFISSAIMGLLGIFFRRGLFKEIIFWNSFIGVLGASIAIYTGLTEESLALHTHRMDELLHNHKRNGYILTGFFLVLCLWMGLRKKDMKSFEYAIWLVFLLIGGISTTYQAYNGEKMVFQEGAGTKHIKEKALKQRLLEETSKSVVENEWVE